MKTRYLFLLLSLVGISCNVFSPRPAEEPDPLSTTSVPDYLNFRGVLRTTGISFRLVDFEELFPDSMIYEDAAGRRHQQPSIVARLNEIAANINAGRIRVGLEWHLLNDREEPVVFDRSKIVTIYRQYIDTVWHTAPGDTLPPDVYTGTSRFDLRFSNLHDTWTIIFWKDIPENATQSFFNP